MKVFLIYVLLFFIGTFLFLGGFYTGPPKKYKTVHKSFQKRKEKDDIKEKLAKIGKLKFYRFC